MVADKAHIIESIYRELLGWYGPQGWWPLLGVEGSNPTKRGSVRGYHPGEYGYPRDDSERFEICAGAILTQNTSWLQVEKVLVTLQGLGRLNPEALLDVPQDVLASWLRPVGYHNQKTRKLKEFSYFYLSLGGASPTREGLLGVWGIGEETADSILLYAYGVPTFVVDAYTRRIFSALGLCDEKARYHELQRLFLESLAPDVEVFQEYHALLVEHAKRYYSRRRGQIPCPLVQKYGRL